MSSSTVWEYNSIVISIVTGGEVFMYSRLWEYDRLVSRGEVSQCLWHGVIMIG